MIEIECTKCGAIVATINAGKIVIDRVQMRVLERDTQGALHCVCICGSKKTFRPIDWLSTAPTTRRRGRRVA